MAGPGQRFTEYIRSGGSFLRERPLIGGAMKIQRREFLHLAAGAVALPVISRVARAQTYPTRPIAMIGADPCGR
jgi:hypothetical protein